MASELPIERLRDGPGPRGTLTVRRAAEPIAARRQGQVVVEIADEFSVHREAPGRLTMWCRHSGSYVLDADTLTVTVDPSRATDDALAHRLACVAVPLLLGERGDLALHASAVETADGAVAFLGDSGSGKSTTAWALGERGFAVLAEDGCVVTAGAPPLLWPGLAGVRLRHEDGAKRAQPAAGASPEPVGLRALVLLQPRGGTSAAVAPVAPAEALLATMPHTLHAQGASLAAAFRGLADVVRGVPVVRGTLPDDLAGAPAHAERLLRLALDASA